jgi:hypothetical protein
MGLFRHLGKAAFAVVAGMRRTAMLRGWIPLVLVSLALASCSGSHSWHQKLVVRVKTPSGIVEGSAVTAVKWWDNDYQTYFGQGAKKFFSLTGEAVVVDLGAGHYLFALLTPGPTAGGETIADLATQVATGKPGRQWSEEAFSVVKTLRAPATVPPQLYPLLVTFGDINDPASVKRVDPNNLELAFGPGYALQSITLSITDEPVTKGEVEKVLGYLIDVGNKRFYLDPNAPALLKDFKPEQLITPSDFLSIDHWKKMR